MTAVSEEDRAALYNAAHPDYPPLSGSRGWVVGTWAVGSCYANQNPIYGAYPRGYLRRVHSMFPDAAQVLHAFSGGLVAEAAEAEAATPAGAPSVELVDVKGPEDGRYPTWQGNVLAMPESWAGRFDLILADPPYSAADAAEYGVKMPNRRLVTRALRRVARLGGNMVWLDTCWPMHRKDEWRTWGHVGLVRSTNHRMRLVSMFRAV